MIRKIGKTREVTTSMKNQITIRIHPVPGTEDDGAHTARAYLVGRNRAGQRYVAPEVFRSTGDAECAYELGLVTPCFLWPELKDALRRMIEKG
jgi:hypothetical protein